jgi:hypothetical protein
VVTSDELLKAKQDLVALTEAQLFYANKVAEIEEKFFVFQFFFAEETAYYKSQLTLVGNAITEQIAYIDSLIVTTPPGPD